MKDRNNKVFVEDILEAMNKIDRYINNLTFEKFKNNEMVVDGVIRNLEVIGEASTHIPTEIREQFTEIPWRKMIGLRNIVIHEYFGIDIEMIWHIVSKNIPETKPQINNMLQSFHNLGITKT